jgi:hypothetical protein
MTENEARLNFWVSPNRTICEILRQINDITIGMGNPELSALILEAFGMAKKMDDKLRQYKEDWDRGFFDTNKDYISDVARRSER